MDKLYASLREELRVFEEQVQKCRVNFDLQTLQRVLTALSEGHKAQLESWQDLEHLIQNGKAGDQWRQLRDYISWLLSYISYLREMKDAFDNHVVFPLCDNIYVNDDGESSPEDDLEASIYPTNIASTARELFHHRRRWALLLSAGSRGQSQHGSGKSHSTSLLNSIPDIFQESLVTSNLARQWILIHETRQKKLLPSSLQVQRAQLNNELRNGTLRRRGFWGSSQSSAKGDPKTENQLKDLREQMMFLLWRIGRAEALELQVKEANQKVLSLQQDINDIQILVQKPGQGTADGQSQLSPETRERLENIKRQLKLERFHQGILNSDLLLELEVRPYLIRQINTVKERCAQLETGLRSDKETSEESPQDSLGVLSDTDWDSSSVYSQASTHMSDVFTSN
ncbi:uncharacterized protein O3C94_020035 [Discoglossus pictus]